MKTWHAIGHILAPPKNAVFWVVSRFHKTTRPRVAIIRGDAILLVKNWGSHHWSLPGGGAHRNEPLEEAAAREVREELGVVIPVGELVHHDTFEQRYYHAPLFIWRVPGETPLVITPHKWEIHDAQWFAVDELPEAGFIVHRAVKALKNRPDLL